MLPHNEPTPLPPQEPQPTPEVNWEPHVLSVDEQIYKENVRMAGEVSLPKPSPLQKFFFWFSEHKPLGVSLVAAITIVLVGGSSAAVYISSKKDNDNPQVAHTDTDEHIEEEAEEEAYQGDDEYYSGEDQETLEEEVEGTEKKQEEAATVPGTKPSTATSATNKPSTTLAPPAKVTKQPTKNTKTTPYPSKVGGIKASATSQNSIKVTWSKTSNAARYTITSATNVNLTTSKRTHASTTSLSQTVTGLSPGVTYYFAVTANNSRGNGTRSNIIGAKTHLQTPGFATISAGTTSIAATPSKVTGANQYQIQLSRNKDMTSPTAVSSTGSSVSARVTSGTLYYLRVRAVDGTLASNWSAIRTAQTKVLNPTGLTLSNITKKKIRASWNTTPGTGYEIRYSTKATMSNSTKITVTSGSAKAITGLKAGTKYWVQVRTLGPGASGWSAAKSATTKKS